MASHPTGNLLSPAAQGPDVTAGPDTIAACNQRDGDGEPTCEREHEACRARVGLLLPGTRIAFSRPGAEGRREGTIAEIPTRYCYRVRVDDGRGDGHLGPGLVAVLWASHGVEVLGEAAVPAPARPETAAAARTVSAAPAPATPAQERHRREWVAAVDGYVAAGRPLPEACRLANQRMECEHAPLSYQEWAGGMHRDDATDATGEGVDGTTKSTKDTNKETTMEKHTHRTGPNCSEEHKREWLGRVIDLVDNNGSTVADARSAANQAMHAKHTTVTMRKWMKELGLRYETTAGELMARAKRAAGTTGKGKKGKGAASGRVLVARAGRIETVPMVDCPEDGNGRGTEALCVALEVAGRRAHEGLLGRAQRLLDAVAVVLGELREGR